MNQKEQQKQPKQNLLGSYLVREKWLLVLITVTGILYNLGIIAGPYFEGQLAQTLSDILNGLRTKEDMFRLALIYVGVIGFIQAVRAVKRLYVRKFANNLNRRMKDTLYGNLIHEKAGASDDGTMMTKALSDVDDCVEGIRKSVTEIFDTGVALIAYLFMLTFYDIRLTVLVLLFPPLAYVIAERLKKPVTESAAALKKSTGALNGRTLDRVQNAMVYRVHGQELHQNELYEGVLNDYEKRAVVSNIFANAMQPLYHIVSMIGAFLILWLGSRYVRSGYWNIAAFSAYLACFVKLAVKSSKAARLFNAIQKARVSWGRVRELLDPPYDDKTVDPAAPADLQVSGLSYHYENGPEILHNVSFTAQPGQIIGVTGEVACGKSTLGKVFLPTDAQAAGTPYEGQILWGGTEWSTLPQDRRYVSYQGHQPELLTASVADNVRLGAGSTDLAKILDTVSLTNEIKELPEGADTVLGESGTTLSGGQQARVALARTLAHPAPLYVLDDPFAAVDMPTETRIFNKLRNPGAIILLITHRITHFDEVDKVLWMENGTVTESTHEELLAGNEKYRALWNLQKGGAENA